MLQYTFTYKSEAWDGLSPHISIVLVTTDRLDCVYRFLTSLSAQQYTDFEVIFVYSNILTLQQIEIFCNNFKQLRLAAVPSEDTCACRSRNIGSQFVRGAIITFADDDCAYTSDTLQQVSVIFNDKEIDGIIGYSFGYGESVPEKEYQPVLMQWYDLFYNAPTYVQFYRKDVLNHVKFDENLGPGNPTPYQCGDETDYALQVQKSGFSLYRYKNVVAYHPRPNLYNPLTKEKTRLYGAGRMRILRKHNLPVWFIALNILYPLFRLPLECLQESWRTAKYRWTMFAARLKWRDAPEKASSSKATEGQI